jgi:SAM-dependent methyltransferase
MSYSNATFNDKNPIKRWLQRRRLVVAARIVDVRLNPQCVLDFGAGNGELCKLIALRFPKAKIVCYEPKPSYMGEARKNLADLPQVQFCTDVAELADGSVDLIFCLEVFEHLPKTQTEDAFRQFNRLLSSDGSAVIGVPVEIGIPALYRGIFRMSRRFGEFDASIKNILLAALCSPPKERPVIDVAPGFPFHVRHMGFDHRSLQSLLHERFRLQKVITSPFSIFGVWLNSEVNFLVQKADQPLASTLEKYH